MSLPADSHFVDFVDIDPSKSLSLAVVGNTRPKPTERMVRSLFERQPVEVVTGEGDGVGELTDGDLELSGSPESAECDRVVLFDDGEIVAESPLSELEATILHVNSDLYITGAVDVDQIELPDVIRGLADTTFHVRGFPESNSEKLPLILISRHVERLSHEHGGTHRASFQRLSRIHDERGTANVYRKLGESAADIHVYGVPDWVPPREAGLKLHGGYEVDYERTWFVVHRSEAEAAALVAIEVGTNEWLGEWTFDRDRVEAVETAIKENL
ncbi:DICT sensory domain-containing protein [Halorubrum salinum]|uniref:DICT sensory domain-containing protein n=1 Tax=Halorubrum salinum TaxID=767517 RepID=UPI0021119F25|nr:DICT sensory domain-containing protein [Halorubrum salinum]